MKMEPKIPKDLKVKIGTPLEVLWTEVKRQTEIEIAAKEKELIVHKAMVKLAKDKILLEQRK